MMFFETLGILLLGLYLLSFARISQPLSLLYQTLERPLPLLLAFFLVLCSVFTLLSFAAMHIWGPSVREFSSLPHAMQSLLSLFSLHANELLPVRSLLLPGLQNSTWWSFLFIVLFLVFLKHTLLSLIAAIVFEEFRVLSRLEEGGRGAGLGQWLKGLVCCCGRCCWGRKARGKDKEEEKKEDRVGVDTLRDKMR
jgi:hypothetical protein